MEALEVISAIWPIFAALIGVVFWVAKNQTKSQVEIETLKEKVKTLFDLINKG